jgi:drug/metabolite transporter (DMT)-like permease
MAYLLLLLLGSIWGASYLFIKLGGETVTPVTLVAMRTTIAGLALLLAIVVRRELIPSWRAPFWRWLAVLGILNSVVPYTLITWGEVYISSGLAAIFVGAMPIFTVVFAHWLTHDEKITLPKVLGIAAGFLGVVILFLPDVLQAATANLFGGLAVLGAAASYAFAAIYARRHLKGESHVVVTFGQMVMASLILVPGSLLLEHPWTLRPTPLSMAAIATLAIAGTAVAYLMYYYLIRHSGATRTSLVTYISPVIAVVLGAVFLGEQLQWTTLLGLVLITAGVGLVTNLRSELTRAAKRASSQSLGAPTAKENV